MKPKRYSSEPLAFAAEKGKTLPGNFDWFSTDSEDKFEKFSIQHKGYWNQKGPIKYDFNSYGFRSKEEFPEEVCRDSITFLGCSNTVGIGLHKENTWPYLLAKEMNLKEINLGISAGSLDASFRVYNAWKHIKSKYVCILTPPTTRYETYIDHPSIYPGRRWVNTGPWSMQDHTDDPIEVKEHFSHMLAKEIQEVREDRNMFAIQYLAEKNDSKLIVLKLHTALAKHDYTRDNDYARDNAHPGEGWNLAVKNIFMDKINE
jgi:hypothetical protein